MVQSSVSSCSNNSHFVSSKQSYRAEESSCPDLHCLDLWFCSAIEGLVSLSQEQAQVVRLSMSHDIFEFLC